MNKLAITRAFGDFDYKIIKVGDVTERRNYITSDPEIRILDIDPFTDDFFVMGSDGLYDKFTSQEIVIYIRNKISQMQ